MSSSAEIVVPASSASGQSEEEIRYPKKRLIVCCDGTWNAGDIHNKPLSNVARIARCISNEDNWKNPNKEQNPTDDKNYISQIVHYQRGVGGGTSWLSNIVDALTGRGISKDIRQAYSFICLNKSRSDDEVVLIGFSRGAFTVRCVAQFMHDVGLLTKSGLRHLPQLYNLWKRVDRNAPNSLEATELERLKEKLVKWKELRVEAIYVRVEACAVWDTVSAIGFPFPSIRLPLVLKCLPTVSNTFSPGFGPLFSKLMKRHRFRNVDNQKPKNIVLAIQALALDEKRKKFKPMVWEDLRTPEASTIDHSSTNQTTRKTTAAVMQCWFAGNHSDVGGGNPDMTLANVCLAWMIGQLQDNIQFDHDSLWAITTSRPWSKPSQVIVNDPPVQGQRKCKVVAKAPVSLEILQTEDSWTSFFQRKYGGSLIRPRVAGRPHYSVCIFDHLKIADYKESFQHSQETGSPNSFLLSDLINSISDPPHKFEGQILEKWTQHILCAHVYIKQFRCSEEEKVLDQAEYTARLTETLRHPATYEATIPAVAILSAFHWFWKRLKDEELDTATWEDFCNRGDGTKSGATFTFTETSEDPTTPELSLAELSPKAQVLTFTRTFELLMGRPHKMATQNQNEKPLPSIITRIFKRTDRAADQVDEEDVRPCKKCAKIWPSEETTPGSDPSSSTGS